MFGDLVKKKVEIHSKLFGTGWSQTYKGVVTGLFQDGHLTFIKLDTGEWINTLYVESIKVIE